MNQTQSNKFQELAPIICENCGSAVPMPENDTEQCIYCAATIIVPEEYKRGRDAKAQLAGIRTHAENFLKRLGRHPGRLEGLLSKIPSYVFFFALIFVMLSFFKLFIFISENQLSIALGVNIGDYLPEIVGVFLYFFSFFAFFALTMSLYFLIRIRVFVIRRLLSVLAAGEPKTPGGPATCRHCGAPFQVKENELIAACSYCGTENFLNVPLEWLSETRKLSKSSGRNVFWAEREYERELNSAKRSLLNQLTVFAAFLLLLGGAFLQADTGNMRNWENEINKTNRQIFSLTKDFPGPEFGKNFKIHGIYKSYSSGHYFEYKVALKKNDRLKFSLIEGQPLQVRLKSKFSYLRKDLTIDSPAEITVEIGGWYDLILIKKPKDPLPTIKIELEN